MPIQVQTLYQGKRQFIQSQGKKDSMFLRHWFNDGRGGHGKNEDDGTRQNIVTGRVLTYTESNT